MTCDGGSCHTTCGTVSGECSGVTTDFRTITNQIKEIDLAWEVRIE